MPVPPGVVPDLATQARNAHIDTAIEGDVVMAAEQFQQLAASQHAVRMLNKDAQQVMVASNQLDFLPGARQLTCFQIIQAEMAEATDLPWLVATTLGARCARRNTARMRASSSRGLQGLAR